MIKLFPKIVVGVVAAMFFAAPGLAGDGPQCGRKGKDQKCQSKGEMCQSRDQKSDNKKDESTGLKKHNGSNQNKVEKRMDKLTEFSFHQSGGFMGADRRYEVKLSELDARAQEQLKTLIGDSGLLKMKGEQKMTQGAADMFVYQFRANSGNKIFSATFDDGTLPDSYRPLVDYLRDKAVDARKR